MTNRELRLALTRRWKLISIAVLAGVLLALGLALAMPASYMSTARLFVAAEADSDDPEELTYRIEVANGRMASYLELADSDAVIQQVADELGGEFTRDQLKKSVSVSSVPETVILDIHATGPSPEKAQEIAQAFATAVPKVIERVEDVGDSRSVQVAITTLETPSLGERATPSLWLSLALGGLLGLVLGVGIAAVRALQLRRTSREDV